MPSRARRDASGLDWSLIDSALVDDESCKLPQTLLRLANARWAPEALDGEYVDVDDPATERFLTNHRVSTLLQIDHVLPAQQEAFQRRLVHIAGMQLRIEATAADVLDRFEQHGIDSRVLKGLASAELDYPDRALRQTGDVDLAVTEDQLDASVQILLDAGYCHHPGERDHAALLKGATLDSPTGIEVDLHTRLFRRGRFTDVIFDSPQPLADINGQAFSAPLRMVHAAGHFILTPPGMRRMSGFVDITVIRQHPDFEVGRTREIAHHLGIEGLVGATLMLEATLSGNESMIDQVAGWNRPDWLDRRTRLVPDRNLVLDHMARFRGLPLSQRLEYLPSWLMPVPRQRQLFKQAIRKRGRIRRSESSRR